MCCTGSSTLLGTPAQATEGASLVERAEEGLAESLGLRQLQDAEVHGDELKCPSAPENCCPQICGAVGFSPGGSPAPGPGMGQEGWL